MILNTTNPLREIFGSANASESRASQTIGTDLEGVLQYLTLCTQSRTDKFENTQTAVLARVTWTHVFEWYPCMLHASSLKGMHVSPVYITSNYTCLLNNKHVRGSLNITLFVEHLRQLLKEHAIVRGIRHRDNEPSKIQETFNNSTSESWSEGHATISRWKYFAQSCTLVDSWWSASGSCEEKCATLSWCESVLTASFTLVSHTMKVDPESKHYRITMNVCNKSAQIRALSH